MTLGVLIKFRKDTNIDARLAFAKAQGFDYCQISCWDESLMTDENAARINTACQNHKIKISTFWCGWYGPAEWNFTKGHQTLGLVPAQYRDGRIKNLLSGSDFAKKLGVNQMATHVGFLPENPNDAVFDDVVCAVRTVAQYCKKNGQSFLFETGQETPITLLRTIEAVGEDNLGINLDTANLIMYGKGNPVDALDVFGKYIMDVHAKDGMYPTNGMELGCEVKIGQGKVDFPRLIIGLKEAGYNGTLIIEREIDGEQQIADIIESKKYIESLIVAIFS